MFQLLDDLHDSILVLVVIEFTWKQQLLHVAKNDMSTFNHLYQKNKNFC
jgi:hypothetical protein